MAGLQAGPVYLSTNAETGYLAASHPSSLLSGGCFFFFNSEKSKTTLLEMKQDNSMKEIRALSEVVMSIGSNKIRNEAKKILSGSLLSSCKALSIFPVTEE